MNFRLGIDVAKAKLDVALRRPDGTLRSKVVANTPQGYAELRTWLLKQSVTDLHVCPEATGTYWDAVAEDLADAGYTVGDNFAALALSDQNHLAARIDPWPATLWNANASNRASARSSTAAAHRPQLDPGFRMRGQSVEISRSAPPGAHPVSRWETRSRRRRS